jgi:RNA polymerase sigma-70 factor, ECF subfamily
MRQHTPALLGGSPIALLYQQLAPHIFDYARQRLSSFEDAEDVLVEVFMAALEYEPFFAMPEPQQQAWLWRVARNKVVDTYRRRGRHQRVLLSVVDETSWEQEIADPEQVSVQVEEQMRLQTLVESLPLLQQEVLRLRFYDDLRCTQIASRLGKREGTIRSILSRTLNHLRRLYEREQEG